MVADAPKQQGGNGQNIRNAHVKVRKVFIPSPLLTCYILHRSMQRDAPYGMNVVAGVMEDRRHARDNRMQSLCLFMQNNEAGELTRTTVIK